MPGSRASRRTRRRRLAVFIGSLMVACALSAAPTSAAATASIAGNVTGPGGAPLAGAEVDVYQQVPPGGPLGHVAGALTDANGAYVVQNLPPGDYKMIFGYPNVNSPYTPEFYNDKLNEASADLVPVADGAAVTGINAELAIGASVSGRFTTPSGVGVAGVTVQAHRSPDGLNPGYYGVTATDANGAYVVQGLPPGTYRLQFHDSPSGPGEYWNDKPSLSAADGIVLSAGQARSGFDAVLGLSPPPPPPPAPTYVQVDGTLKKATYKARKRKFTATVASNSHTPLPNELPVSVVWKLKVGSKTVKTISQSWNEIDKLATRLPLRSVTKTYRVRVLEGGKKVFDKRYTVKAG